MTVKNKPNGPLTGWLEAGSELIAEQLAGVTRQLNQQIETQQQAFDELQTRGAVIDAKIRNAISPSSVITNVEQMIRTNPLWSLLPTFNRKSSQRAVQLDALSAKVDILVEQVALLAAKEAKLKAEKAQTSTLHSEASDIPAATVSKSAPNKDAAVHIEPQKPSRRPSTRKKTVTTTAKAKTRAVTTSHAVKPSAKK